MKKRKRVSLHSKLRSLIKADKEITITYVYNSGGKITKTLSDRFIKVRNKPRKVHSIVKDIHAICHDLNAKYFIV